MCGLITCCSSYLLIGSYLVAQFQLALMFVHTHKVSFLEICTVKPIASYLKRASKLSWDTVLASTK